MRVGCDNVVCGEVPRCDNDTVDTKWNSLFLSMEGLINPEHKHVSWINEKFLAVGDKSNQHRLKPIRWMNIRDEIPRLSEMR